MRSEKEKNLEEFLQHAENVGEEMAISITERIYHLVDGIHDFSDRFYNDPSFRDKVGQTQSVGRKTMESIYELVESIEEGETEIVIDNTGRVRVMYTD